MKKSLRSPQNTCRDYAGLKLYAVLQRIASEFPQLGPDDIDITYAESPLPRFTVISCRFEKPSRLYITAASANPLRYLPSNFKDNAFLRGFLMVFQHIANETLLAIDNLSSWFKPMECPEAALAELSGWLGAEAETSGAAEELRRFLQYALPLYRLRGTSRGLETRLGLACGRRPRIIENELPAALVMREEGETESRIFEADSAENCFTVLFPAPRESFSEELIHRISRIVSEEKPAHTRCFISFAPPGRKRRKMTTLREDTLIGREAVGCGPSAHGHESEGFFI